DRYQDCLSECNSRCTYIPDYAGMRACIGLCAPACLTSR
uniref:Nigellin-1.1 n=1 Tax=Nigella sativa TaxID=555479 RepID=A0A1S4NYD1_NIGSA|nr:Chain A, nigellin-1.1 [Nigella sativa]